MEGKIITNQRSSSSLIEKVIPFFSFQFFKESFEIVLTREIHAIFLYRNGILFRLNYVFINCIL